MLSGFACEIVIVGVLSDSSVHEGPSDPIYGILFVLNSSSDHIGIQVVVERVV
jgi:hypothetical protein